MTINNNVTVVAGKPSLKKSDVESNTEISHATTGYKYSDDAEAKADVINPATSTTENDIRRDVTIKVNNVGEMIGKVMDE
jgi:hypothetical protein